MIYFKIAYVTPTVQLAAMVVPIPFVSVVKIRRLKMNII